MREEARERIQVFARIRPDREESVAALDERRLRLWRSEHARDAGLAFQFDTVIGVGAPQREVFDRCRRVVRAFVDDGVPATLLAFGQTGSGKTYTMFGPPAPNAARPDEEGLTPRALREVFALGVQSVECSCLEVYQDQVYDLLAVGRRSLDIRDVDAGVRVRGLQVVEVRSLDQALHLLTLAARHRTVAHNGVNAVSSRAHTVFQLRCARSAGSLQLVDLAGSEKIAQQRTSDALPELAAINRSLSCLGLCIASLCDRKRTHVPYRSSKLTRLLREALDSARGQVILVVCISPLRQHVEETLSSLQFADRAKRALLLPRARPAPNPAREAGALKAEIDRLESLLGAERGERQRLEGLLGKRLKGAAPSTPSTPSPEDSDSSSSPDCAREPEEDGAAAPRWARADKFCGPLASPACAPRRSHSETHSEGLWDPDQCCGPLLLPAASEGLWDLPDQSCGPLVSPTAAERPERHRPPPPGEWCSSPSAARAISPWGHGGPQRVFAALLRAPSEAEEEPLSPQGVADDLHELHRSHVKEIEALANRARNNSLALYSLDDSQRWDA